jgi:hypothetical protein
MENQNALYKECLVRGIGSISSSRNTRRTVKYIRARETFCSLIDQGEKEEVALSVALFDAVEWDWDEYIKVLKVVNKTLKAHKAVTLKV